jgi:hypothetical protein
MKNETPKNHTTIIRGLGSAALTASLMAGIKKGNAGFGAGVSSDGKMFMVFLKDARMEMTVLEVEEVVKSLQYSLETAAKIRSGEIKITIPPVQL